MVRALLAALLLTRAHAAPLGPVSTPSVKPAAVIEWFSDLWTRPQQNKPYPLRYYDLSLNAPVLAQPSFTPVAQLSMDGLSSGRADLVVGRNQVLIGSDLRSQSAGVGIVTTGNPRDRWSGHVAYRSDSDQPFEHPRDEWVDTAIRYESENWNLGADYSQNRGYLNGQVLPSGDWRWAPSENFDLLIGFPLNRLRWRGTSGQTQIKLTPTGAEFSALRELPRQFEAGIIAGYMVHSFLHVNRIQDNMRLFFEQEYVELRLNKEVNENSRLGFSLGWAFDRDFYEAKQIYQRIGSRVTIPEDAFGGIRWDYRW